MAYGSILGQSITMPDIETLFGLPISGTGNRIANIADLKIFLMGINKTQEIKLNDKCDSCRILVFQNAYPSSSSATSMVDIGSVIPITATNNTPRTLRFVSYNISNNQITNLSLSNTTFSYFYNENTNIVTLTNNGFPCTVIFMGFDGSTW